MRVVLTANFSPWSRYAGGGQRSTHALACALSARGHDVHVVYTKPPWERVATPRDLPYALHWATLLATHSRRDALLRPLSAWSVARCVGRLVREGIDVIHAQGEEAALLVPYASRLVVTPRFPSYPAALSPRSTLPQRASLLLRDGKYLQIGRALTAARWVCPTSSDSARAVMRAFGVAEERLRVVQNGVDASFFAARRAPRRDRPQIVFYGRIEREKGVDLLLDAFLRLRDARAELVLIGEGKYLPEALRRAAHGGVAPRVKHVGWLDPAALVGWLERASLVVLPSREESFGNAMIESLAAGAPLLTSDAGSIPELMRHGEHAVLTPQGDACALGDALRTLLDEPERAERMGSAGRAHVRARYGWAASAGAYEALYRELAESTAAGSAA